MHDDLLIKRAALVSLALHVFLAALALGGRWIFRDTRPPEPFVSVELVDIAALTQAKQRFAESPKDEPPAEEPAPTPPEPTVVPPEDKLDPQPTPSEPVATEPEPPTPEASPEAPQPTPPAQESSTDDAETGPKSDDTPTPSVDADPIPDDTLPLALPKPKPAYKPNTHHQQALTSILKNLLPKKTAAPAEPSPDPDKKDKPKPQKAAARHSSSRLSDRDTVRLQDAIRQQLMPCWNPPAAAKNARDLVVSVDISISPEGIITRAEVARDGRMSDPFYRAAAESARRATRNPRCQPLKLPAEHYEDWREVTLIFDPKNL